MDKKSAFQVLDSANEELQGKMKNLVWCDAEQKGSFYCRAGKL